MDSKISVCISFNNGVNRLVKFEIEGDSPYEGLLAATQVSAVRLSPVIKYLSRESCSCRNSFDLTVH